MEGKYFVRSPKDLSWLSRFRVRSAFGSNLPPDLKLHSGVGPEYTNSFVSCHENAS